MAWAPDYTTTAALASYLSIPDSDDDVQLALAVAAASRAIDRATGRQFGVVDEAEERTYTGRWDRRRCRWVIEVDDFMDDADLAVTIDAGAITPVVLQPVNAAQVGRPWTFLVVDPDSPFAPTGVLDEVTVEALWGWTAVPDTIVQATLLQASRVFKRRQAPFGVAGSPDTGSEMRLLAKVDPDVEVMVRSYTRWWAAA